MTCTEERPNYVVEKLENELQAMRRIGRDYVSLTLGEAEAVLFKIADLKCAKLLEMTDEQIIALMGGPERAERDASHARFVMKSAIREHNLKLALARALALLERVRPGLKQQSNQFALNARESGVDGLDNQYAALLADIDAFRNEVASD